MRLFASPVHHIFPWTEIQSAFLATPIFFFSQALILFPVVIFTAHLNFQVSPRALIYEFQDEYRRRQRESLSNVGFVPMPVSPPKIPRKKRLTGLNRPVLFLARKSRIWREMYDIFGSVSNSRILSE
jgi:hypothetical protein